MIKLVNTQVSGPHFAQCNALNVTNLTSFADEVFAAEHLPAASPESLNGSHTASQDKRLLSDFRQPSVSAIDLSNAQERLVRHISASSSDAQN